MTPNKLVSRLLVTLAFGAFSAGAMAVDVDAAKDLMKENKCTQCHGMTKDKDAPAFSNISAKYKGKANAESKLLTHLTTSPKVKLADGSEEEHKVMKTTPAKDAAQIKNAIQYILTL